jgi:Tfp pilus assembly protein PilN
MIRINLLGERKKQLITLKAPTGPPKSSFLILLFLLVFVVAGAYLFFRHQYLVREQSRIQDELVFMEKEKARRQQMLNEIGKFEKEKKVLESRIAVINELKRNQLGPIRWLNSLSTATDQTPNIWLVAVGQTGNQMTLEGMATSIRAVANFVTALKRAEAFKNVVINETSQTTVSGMEDSTFYIFFIACEVK